MKAITINTYKFEELSPKAKAKAIEENRYINVEFENWHDFITDEKPEELAKLGYHEAEILMSGFGSQGDGACFTAKIDIEDYIKAHKLTNKFRKLYNESKGYGYNAQITHFDRYCHSTSTRVERLFNYELSEEAENQLDDLIELIEAERETIGNELYKALEEAYYSLLSDESIAETLQINEYDFLEDGSRSYHV